jgi:hypothetical protein
MSEPVSLMGIALDLKSKQEQSPLCRDYYPEQEKPMRNILEEAEHIVNGDRQLEYGDKRECFTRIANMWAAYLGVEVSSFDVVHMMIMLKLARNVHKYKRDSMVDVAGYAYCADIMHDEILAERSKLRGD